MTKAAPKEATEAAAPEIGTYKARRYFQTGERTFYTDDVVPVEDAETAAAWIEGGLIKEA